MCILSTWQHETRVERHLGVKMDVHGRVGNAEHRKAQEKGTVEAATAKKPYQK